MKTILKGHQDGDKFWGVIGPKAGTGFGAAAWRIRKQLLAPLALFPLESLGDFWWIGGPFSSGSELMFTLLTYEWALLSRPVPTHKVNIDLLPPPQGFLFSRLSEFQVEIKNQPASLGLRTAPSTVSCILSGIKTLRLPGDGRDHSGSNISPDSIKFNSFGNDLQNLFRKV